MGYLADLTTTTHRRLYSSYEGSLSKGQEERSITWKVSIEELEAFLSEVSGTEEIIGEPPDTITRVVPLRCPDKESLLAGAVQWKAVGASDATDNVYTHALVTVTFRTPEFDFDDETLASRRLRFGGNFVTVPGRIYEFPSGLRLNQDAGRFVPEQEISYTLHKVTSIDQATILSLVGKVNNATFLECAAGTVLFSGADTDSEDRSLGSDESQIQLAFTYRPIPWNHVQNPTSGDWEEVTVVGGSATIYEEADLSPLLSLA